MNTKIVVVCILSFAIIIGVGIGLYVKQKTVDAEQMGFDSPGDLIVSDTAIEIAKSSSAVRDALNFDEP